jgi:hypothetical protein
VTLAYIEKRIRQVIQNRSPDFGVTAQEIAMCQSSLVSGEYGKKPAIDAPWQHRGEGGLPNYGSPDRLFNSLAATHDRNVHAQIDPAEMLDMALLLNNNRFFEAICGCYNAGRNLAAYERDNCFASNGFSADTALANIRPPGDPWQKDKAGPVYHLFGIGVVTFGVGHDLAEIGSYIQQFAGDTNNKDQFKHGQVGKWAVSLFYQLRRENDWWFDQQERALDTLSKILTY